MFASSLIGRIALVVARRAPAVGAVRGRDGRERARAQYRVKPGDTLWSIAERTFPGDPREGVWELRERNELDSAVIVPGQVLVLPA